MRSTFANVGLSVRKAVVLALVLILCSNQASDLIKFPSEVADAKLGETISLRCILKSNLADIEWYHQKIGSTQDRTVYLDRNIYMVYKERFSVSCNESNQECGLNIANVNSTDAGKYSCKHNDVTASVELIVFEAYPSNESCSVPNDYSKPIFGGNPCNIAAATVHISCKIKYYGNKVPAMVWTDDYKKIINSSLSKDERNHITHSTIQLIAQSTTKVTCTIQFFAPNITSKISWTRSVEVVVLSNSSTEDNTNCSSLNQTCGKIVENCQSQWMLPNGTLITSSKTLVLTDLESGDYECNNVCPIRRQNCVIRQRTVKHFCNTDSPSETGASAKGRAATIAGAVIGTVVAVAIVAVVVYIGLRKKTNRNHRTARPPNVNPNAQEHVSLKTSDDN